MRIDDEFSRLIPPLTEEEYAGLEASILKEGCRDALVCWGDKLIDGHNRYRICREHEIPYKVLQLELSNREEVLRWIMRNQLSRRNLNDFQRVELVRRCEEAVREQAKRRQAEYYGNQYESGLPPKLAGVQKRDSREELAELAGVGHTTYEHATAVLDKAPEAVIEATRKKELSINAAYEVTKLSEEKQAEIAERIEQGETAKAVISSVKREKKAQAEVPASIVEQPTSPPKLKNGSLISYDYEAREFFESIEKEYSNDAGKTDIEKLRDKAEAAKKAVVVTELLEGTETRWKIRGEGKQDCLILIWVKAGELGRLFDAVFSGEEFDYKGLALVWSCEGIVKEVCVIGTRGKAEVPEEIMPRVVDAEPDDSGKHPRIFDDMVKDMFNNSVSEGGIELH